MPVAVQHVKASTYYIYLNFTIAIYSYSYSREDQPHVQGAVAARAQEGLEELSHVEGQEGRRR